MVAVIEVERLEAADVAAALRIFNDATERDGVHPLSEEALLRLRDGAGALLLRDGDRLLGYATRSADVAELVVDPAERGKGHGRTLTRELLARDVPAAWAHGELPSARALAAEFDFERARALWRMSRPLAGPSSEPLPDYRVPDGVVLRAFRVGADEDAWARVNGRAFADHPEQGAWTARDLQRREQEPWFDPAGFFVAERTADGSVLGFHWTKAEDGHGEVYVVGVDPDAQGMGLGRTLTLAGLYHLRDAGLSEVILYVDESNAPAVALYRSLGFVHSGTDAMYRAPR
jgi:mycothiol synthase